MKGGQAGKGGVSKELKGHFDELKKWNDKKRDIFAKREELDGEIGRLNQEIVKLLKLCHSVYNSLDQLEKGKKILERRHQTTTMSSKDEKQLIGEIAQIDKSAPTLKKIEEIRNKIGFLKEQQKKEGTDLHEIKKVIDGIKKAID